MTREDDELSYVAHREMQARLKGALERPLDDLLRTDVALLSKKLDSFISGLQETREVLFEKIHALENTVTAPTCEPAASDLLREMADLSRQQHYSRLAEDLLAAAEIFEMYLDKPWSER